MELISFALPRQRKLHRRCTKLLAVRRKRGETEQSSAAQAEVSVQRQSLRAFFSHGRCSNARSGLSRQLSPVPHP